MFIENLRWFYIINFEMSCHCRIPLTLKARGRGNWPIENKKGYSSGTEGWIDLKPGYKFRFFFYLEGYLKNNDQYGP